MKETCMQKDLEQWLEYKKCSVSHNSRKPQIFTE